MGILLGTLLTAIVVALGGGVTLLTGLLMAMGTAIVTGVVGLIASLMILI